MKKAPRHLFYLKFYCGHLPGFQGDTKGLDDLPSKGMLPGYVPNSSASFLKSLGNFTPNKTATSR